MKFTFRPFKNDKSPQADPEPSTPLSRTQKRKEQIRRAQKTHRERKEEYIKSLENEVIELRANKAKVSQENQALHSENRFLRRVLADHNISLPPRSSGTQSVDGQTPPKGSSEQSFEFNIREFELPNRSKIINVQRSTTQVPQPHQIPSSVSHNIGNLQATPHVVIPNPHTHSSPPPLPYPTAPPITNTAAPLMYLDHAAISLDFILTLESPCLDHTEGEPDQSPSAPTGHALTLSASLLHQHPDPTSHHLDPGSSWQVPGDGIQKLLELSDKLPLEGEVTPVQAWNYIRCQPGFEGLELARLEGLKAELVGFVKCYGFGGVIEMEVLEEVVRNVFALGAVS